MKRKWTRWIALLLTVVMTLSMMPPTVFASLLDNDPAVNREILSRLEDLVGSPEEAARYYALLQQYNLLDEDGNMMDSWTIIYNGSEITTEELLTMLDDPDRDMDEYVIVDGTVVTLEQVKTMIEIESCIAYLRKTYFDGQVWTQEQIDSFRSLTNQINTRGIMMYAAEEAVDWPSNVDHTARMNISNPNVNGDTAAFTASLTRAVPQAVSFSWQALSGSQTVSGSGTVTFAPGETSKTFSVTLPDISDTVHSSAEPVYYIKVDNIQGALLSDGTDAMTLKCTASETASIPNPGFSFMRTMNFNRSSTEYIDLSSDQINAIRWGMSDTVEIIANNGTKPKDEEMIKKDSVTGAYEITHLIVYLRHIYFEAKSANNIPLVKGEYFADFDGSSNAGEQWLSIYMTGDMKASSPFNPGVVGDSIAIYSYDIGTWYSYRNDDLKGGWQPTNDPPKEYHDLPVTVNFSDETAPYLANNGVTAPAGTYYPGQVVPVTVTFSEPVNAATARVKFNGGNQEYSAAEVSGCSNVLTFPYTVQELDNATLSISSVYATDTVGHTMTVNPGGDVQTGGALTGVTLSTPVTSHAITGMSASFNNSPTEPKLMVIVSVSGNEKLTNWLVSDIDPVTKQTQNLRIKVGGKDTTYPLTMKGDTIAAGLTAEIPLDIVETAATHIVELVYNGELMIGKYAGAEQAPAKLVTAKDIDLTLSVKQSDGVTDYKYDDTGTIYLQEDPKVSASYELTGSGYSFAGKDQFKWSSSNLNVANIDPDTGAITGTGSGEVYFTLTAQNGGIEGRAVQVKTDTLKFGMGLTPFLLIPNDKIQSVGGQPVTVYWSSNICDKNGENPTVFKVEVRRGVDTVYSHEVTGTASAPAAKATIPADKLEYDYSNSARNNITVEVSTVYDGAAYSGEATISIASPPAVVNFGKLDTYYITDETKKVEINWNIKNFDQFSGNDLFELYITRGNTLVIRNTNDPGVQTGAGTGEYNGSYALNIADVQATPDNPVSYREVYTVTIKAKNGEDSTWSYDSFLLYVYDADALKIMVDGGAADSVTMSNIEKISGMSQDDVLALKREIYLKNMISVNYGEGGYAWNEVADQILWASDDSAVASVNYQQGTLYENIENFNYVSYRPTTDLGLSGLSDGTALVTAIHKLTGMTEKLDVTVKTLKDKLYLFQCYPQAATTLTYIGSDGKEHTAASNASGAAAIYDAGGIRSDVYCSAVVDGVTYLGTFYRSRLATGEGDWTRLERYPQNNLELRRAAYAYLYVKNPDGTPYTDSIIFHGGVYVDGEYKQDARFSFRGGDSVNLRGDGDGQTVKLGSDGKLTVIMDQTQWGLPGGAVTAKDNVSYVFEIGSGKDEYYPLFVTVDATVNQNAFVGSGEAIVNFRKNDGTGKHPFIAQQYVRYPDITGSSNVLDSTGTVGINTNHPESTLTTQVMWWGGDMEDAAPKLQLVTESGVAVAAKEGQYEIVQSAYPFTDKVVTEYTVKFNKETVEELLALGQATNIYLDYYRDGETLSRHEFLSFKLANLLGVESVSDSVALINMVHDMGSFIATDAGEAQKPDFGDVIVAAALKLVAGDSYTTGDKKMFSIQVAPTSDPTKFLGFIEVNVDNMPKEVQMGNTIMDYKTRTKYTPGLNDVLAFTGLRSPADYLDASHMDVHFKVSGYMESLIYYDFNVGEWKIKILSGGFDAGGGAGYKWDWNSNVGPIPLTVSLNAGGTASVSMNALTVAYYNANTGESGMGNDFLTQLRIYLYLRAFAGVGFDYSLIALKLGIFGEVTLDMRFAWLNRPYMESGVVNLADDKTNEKLKDIQGKKMIHGQRFILNGQIGVEAVAKLGFLSFDIVFWSYGFNMLDETTNKWEEIHSSWDDNQKAEQAVVSELLNTGSMSVSNVGGQQMLSLNLAPTLESRDYLGGRRTWGPGISLFSLDKNNGLKNLETNTYPYANPLVSDDGELVVYLSDMNSENVTDTRAAFAVKAGTSYASRGVIDNSGYGDSQVSLSGTDSFAVAAWTRQMVNLDKKDAGAVLTVDDQVIMMNGADVFAAVYTNGSWNTIRLNDENGTADLAPVVAANNNGRAIAAWRAVASNTGETVGNYTDIANFDEKDTIVYRVYDQGNWGEIQTLYNGTSGAVKGITAAMLDDGTAAVAYTLDSDSSDNTITDREIYYAVVDSSGEVSRNVRATNDAYLDENPQLTAVTFPGDGGKQHFVLGWYTAQSVAGDDAAVLDAGDTSGSGKTTSDIRLIDFDSNGVTGQLLPDSISQVAAASDVSITSTFRFTRNAESINDLSILWVERADELSEGVDVEKDVLKGVKFYTYGQNDEQINFTGAIDVAEMDNGTLIDHFDAYVSDPGSNEIKAVILGTTYGAEGTVTKTGEAVGGETVSYVVPSSSSAMYTATETYKDQINVPALLADYNTVKKGAATQIMFTVENKGIHTISALDITVGGQTTSYSDLNLLPGTDLRLYADYTVPASGVVDPQYTVTPTFSEAGASGTADADKAVTGTVYLDFPDVEITEAKVVDEENGTRTVQIKLNNDSDAALAWKNRSVQIKFYSDVTCEKRIQGLEPITVSDNDALKMMDEGGCSIQTTFDVKELADAENPLTEIPDGGIAVYIKAEVLENGETLPEPISSNNYSAVTAENLKVRTGRDVSITSDLAVDSDGTATVTVSLQNNRLSATTTGNVIVTLLNANGEVLAVKQSYTGTGENNGLITLGGEEKWTNRDYFTFKNVEGAASVQVTYSDVIIGQDNANLTSLTFSNIPGITLESFVEDPDDPGVYHASVSTDDLTAATVMAVAESNLTEISVYSNDGIRDGNSNIISRTVKLIKGAVNTVTVVAVSDSGTTKTYVLSVQNNGDPVMTWPNNENAMEAGYSTTVTPNGGDAVITLTAAAKPQDGYPLSYQWYGCDLNGNMLEELAGETSDTLIVPGTIGMGVHYYICKVIREMINGATTEYWSSIATVRITAAGENFVTLEGDTVPFDNQPHSLKSAAAAMEGSTIYYSADGGASWSTSMPRFTAVGVHTVWAYAVNPGYEDTAKVTADVVIREAEGTRFKLEERTLQEAFDSYPAKIKEKYADAEAMETALKAKVTALGIAENNTMTCDVKLLFSLDDGATWIEAAADNFPTADVTVVLPYPNGTNRYNYKFVLYHLIVDPLNTGKTPGDIEEIPDITLTEDGIRSTTDCLSPFILGWSKQSSGSSSGGSNISTHTINISAAEHGKVTVTPTQAAGGSIVTMTVTPDKGYKLLRLTATDSQSNGIKLTDKGNGVYTFSMPDRNVTVEALFTLISDPDDAAGTEQPKDICNGGPDCPGYAFIDLDAHAWYHESVDYAIRNGLMNGYGNGTFGPDDDLARAMLAQILYNLEGKPGVTGRNPFTDVSSGTWYADAVTWAASNGIVTGSGGGLYKPGDPITREQLAVMLYRYEQSKGGRTTGTRISQTDYTDTKQISDWAYDAMSWCTMNGIIKGKGDSILDPKGKATRAEVATMLMRFLSHLTGK